MANVYVVSQRNGFHGVIVCVCVCVCMRNSEREKDMYVCMYVGLCVFLIAWWCKGPGCGRYSWHVDLAVGSHFLQPSMIDCTHTYTRTHTHTQKKDTKEGVYVDVSVVCICTPVVVWVGLMCLLHAGKCVCVCVWDGRLCL